VGYRAYAVLLIELHCGPAWTDLAIAEVERRLNRLGVTGNTELVGETLYGQYLLPFEKPILLLVHCRIRGIEQEKDAGGVGMVPIHHFLFLGAALFTIGVIGVLTRKNIMVILMSIELMMNAVNINLIAFSAHLGQTAGQIFAIFVITVAAAEAAVGLGIVIAMFRNKETMNINEIDLMKW
jgi:NADH-quinone oxidoreductase subunit K